MSSPGDPFEIAARQWPDEMTDLTAAEQAVAKTLNAALLPFLIAGATPQDLDPLIDALTIDLRYLLKEELLLYRRDEG